MISVFPKWMGFPYSVARFIRLRPWVLKPKCPVNKEFPLVWGVLDTFLPGPGERLDGDLLSLAGQFLEGVAVWRYDPPLHAKGVGDLPYVKISMGIHA